MTKSDNHQHRDIIDEDLYEEIDEEEMIELVETERQKALQQQDEEEKPKRPFPKWAFWLIAIAMFINVVAILPQTFSIPAIDFLVTSAKLSTDDAIKEYRQSVVVVEAGNSKGTGFSIASDGLIITNHHVIDDETRIMVAFQEEGLFAADVIESYPDIDLAVLKVEGNGLPSLTLADKTDFEMKDHIYFIGNPLKFQGIANEGEIAGYTKLENWEKEVFMLEAPVYRGNSGSPVINQNGKVIGVIFATLNHDEHGKVGLAVPIDYFHAAYPSEK
ncbi:S1C family serine protease [Aquibacillus albus]|uniref:S1-C subfamily serine protease n=1 Tax=Aquibacillus albus TaxID=1168171 RepID=A0ABS2N0E8_9BACI|nr:serine protease [Aquibacillus albus]MBM7571616.1 S1-C subfamily serine protease [Aquibacillus albus]